ncbi:F-box/FBD/LRR-repeat protein [Heracleum sosnowskyi]|uniref:F-box/FBD/LRR-repeat protein n=1 Tax=Heracleum sosnowskyi TaxID=360622 RepID=A0AAD8MVZ6_9APIA|nr:F-box/FBD/LRR-repeat protein [Heracleum sosnowskyi]
MISTSKLHKLLNEDRISELPDPILTEILSFIPTKSAVKTALLSKRWKTPYLSLPNLDFVDDKWYLDDIFNEVSRHKINFMNLVDRVLRLRGDNIDIDRFSLNCIGNYDTGRVDGWIRIVVGHNVKEINLSFKFKKLYELGQDVYMCASVKILRLSCKILVDVPENVGFSRLKVLEFICVTFSSFESVERLLLNCPLLEDLVIESCKWISGCCLCICGSMLKNLTLDSPISLVHVEKVEPKILIDTPALQTLKIEEFISKDISIKEQLRFLTIASIDIALRLEWYMQSRAYGDMVFGLLNKIYHVKYLTLSENTLGALDYASYDGFPTFHNLTMLELHFDTSSCWTLLPYMLSKSPNLRSLVFPNGLAGMFSTTSSFMWNPPKLVPECLSSHLKTIEIKEFLGTYEELSLFRFLLEYGRSLRKISVDCSHVPYAKIQEKFLMIRRGSKTCKLDLIL